MFHKTGKHVRDVVSVIFLILFFIAVFWSIGFHARLDWQTPALSEWTDAAARIASNRQDGDFIAIVPFWASEGEVSFYKKNLRYQYVRYASMEDWPGIRRLWVVEAHDRFADRDKMIAKWGEPDLAFNSGPLHIELFVLNGNPQNIFDFREHLHEAEAFVRIRNEERPCDAWDAKYEKFACERRFEWHNLGRIVQEIGDAVRSTIWAHPKNGQEMVARFRNVKASKAIIVHAGLTLYATALKDGAPVFIDVIVDGKKIKRIEHANEREWRRYEVPLTNVQGDIHDVEFAISTPQDGRRHFSFTAYAY